MLAKCAARKKPVHLHRVNFGCKNARSGLAVVPLPPHHGVLNGRSIKTASCCYRPLGAAEGEASPPLGDISLDGLSEAAA
jgi:hypothetical protein